MKKMSKSILGVTLLEVMLVLAIAAMVIVMSVRYYQSANANQQATSTMQQIQGIIAAADGLAQAGGSYTVVTTAAVQPLMPGNTMKTAWGDTVTIGTTTATSYQVTIGKVPYNVCPIVLAQLKANLKFSTSTTCPTSGTADIVYTYTPGA
jgi:type II secretory pathway pseudopilin PulG